MTVAALPPFSALLDAHGAELLAHARRLSGPADAEDLLQEALLRALRAYPRLRHGEHLRAWLYRIVTTTAIDGHRARRPEILVDAPPQDAAALGCSTVAARQRVSTAVRTLRKQVAA